MNHFRVGRLVVAWLLCTSLSGCASEGANVGETPILVGGIMVRPVGPARFGSGDNDGVTAAELSIVKSKINGSPARMGARLLRNGIEYVTTKDFPVDGPTRDTAPKKDKGTLARGDSDSDFGTASSPLIGIIGSDDRYHITFSSASWPWSTSVAIVRTDGTKCSASLIGPHTLITAGHCFYNPGTGAWRATDYFAPGADYQTSGTYPYGKLYYYNLWIPGDYHQKGDGFDFAVVDLSPSGLSGAPGWLGTIILPFTVFSEAQPVLRSGYDGDLQAYGTPGQWASGGTAYPADNTHTVSNFLGMDLDARPGSSGAGVYINSGSNSGRVVAIVTGGYEEPFAASNTGTHWLQWTHNFVHAVDTSWP